MAILFLLICLWWTFGYIWRRARARARRRPWQGWPRTYAPN